MNHFNNNTGLADLKKQYRFTGSNYKGQSPEEVCEIFRKWLKETYPSCKFSLTRKHYNSISIVLVSADFEAFSEKANGAVYTQINHYSIDKNDKLTDRAKEVLKNVCCQINSYNFDDSDAMTDYFHCNFYLNVYVGSYTHPYKVVLSQLKHKGKNPEVFRRPEGIVHKTIRQALGKAEFAEYEHRRGKNVLLCEKHFNEDGSPDFYPLLYSSKKTAQKRMDKLNSAGILCRLTGYYGGYIEFLGYTPGTEAALEKEKQESEVAERQWKEKQLKAA